MTSGHRYGYAAVIVCVDPDAAPSSDSHRSGNGVDEIGDGGTKSMGSQVVVYDGTYLR